VAGAGDEADLQQQRMDRRPWRRDDPLYQQALSARREAERLDVQPPQPRDVRGERHAQPLTLLVRQIRLIHPAV